MGNRIEDGRDLLLVVIILVSSLYKGFTRHKISWQIRTQTSSKLDFEALTVVCWSASCRWSKLFRLVWRKLNFSPIRLDQVLKWKFILTLRAGPGKVWNNENADKKRTWGVNRKLETGEKPSTPLPEENWNVKCLQDMIIIGGWRRCRVDCRPKIRH